MAWTLPINTNNTEATCQVARSPAGDTLSCQETGFEPCLNFCGTDKCPHSCKPNHQLPVLVPLNDAKSTKRQQQNKHFRQSRFFVRLQTGIQVANSIGQPARAFTLTESDEAIASSIDFGRALNKFHLAFRREYGGRVAVAWVEHRQGDKKRFNRHVITYNSGKLNPEFLETKWQRYYKSKVTGLELIWSPKGFSFYLTKYLGNDDKFVRARFSNNWIFPNWWQWSKLYKREHGYYPSVETVTTVSMLVNQQREGVGSGVGGMVWILISL